MRRLRVALMMVGAITAVMAAPVFAADIAAGKIAFTPCASCHQLGPYAHAGFGPQLNGVLGRKAGSTADFKYSDAMKKAGFVWDEARLAAFIKDSDQVVPGNKMRFSGFGYDQKKLADLMAYLRAAPSLP